MSIKTVKFHIKSEDYFATLASVLNLMVQGNVTNPSKTLEGIVKDLMWLQDNYKIIKK